MILHHRVSTAREEKGWGRCFFCQIEPNWPLPYSTVPVPWLRDARLCRLLLYSICANTMPRVQNRAGKGSSLLQRRFTFPIFLLFILCSTTFAGGKHTNWRPFRTCLWALYDWSWHTEKDLRFANVSATFYEMIRGDGWYTNVLSLLITSR